MIFKICLRSLFCLVLVCWNCGNTKQQIVYFFRPHCRRLGWSENCASRCHLIDSVLRFNNVFITKSLVFHLATNFDFDLTDSHCFLSPSRTSSFGTTSGSTVGGASAMQYYQNSPPAQEMWSGHILAAPSDEYGSSKLPAFQRITSNAGYTTSTPTSRPTSHFSTLSNYTSQVSDF